MIIITHIFKPFWGTDYFLKSVNKLGYEVAVNKTTDNPADIMRTLYDCYKRAATGHDYFAYIDSADSVILKTFEPPKDRIVYQAEKACFPHKEKAKLHPETKSDWKYLNGGGYTGPLTLITEFFERYKLNNIGGKNPQDAQMEAFFQAKKDGFPIDLDTNCEIFQSLAFEEKGDFEIKKGKFKNKLTKTFPAILHGNGRTEMKHIYELI